VVADELWCRITIVGPDGEELEQWTLSGPGHPDLAAVELLARLRLASGRAGRDLVVRELSGRLAGLLELSGLRREVRGQPEELEERPIVQEEVEPRDPPA
jgi:hypothetical protein